MFDGYLSDRPENAPLPALSQATEVRSEISMAADSLQMVVGWDLSLSDSSGVPDSVRVRVIPLQGDRVMIAVVPTSWPTPHTWHPTPGRQRRVSPAWLPSTPEPLEEVCTPWQYVRPLRPRCVRLGSGRSSSNRTGCRWIRMSMEGAPSGSGPMPRFAVDRSESARCRSVPGPIGSRRWPSSVPLH